MGIPKLSKRKQGIPRLIVLGTTSVPWLLILVQINRHLNSSTSREREESCGTTRHLQRKHGFVTALLFHKALRV